MFEFSKGIDGKKPTVVTFQLALAEQLIFYQLGLAVKDWLLSLIFLQSMQITFKSYLF